MNWKFWKKSPNKKKAAKKKSAGREWLDAIVFAVVAATLIRGLFIEAYTIPTGSMEKSLLIGDFLCPSYYAHYRYKGILGWHTMELSPASRVKYY
jgi:hypothetical protein